MKRTLMAALAGIALMSPFYAAIGETIQLERQRGGDMVPVRINEAITLPFLLDSGATEISIPTDVFLTLLRTGTVNGSDSLGIGKYVLADGSEQSSDRFNLHEVRVGDHVVRNVTANVAPVKGDPLLGQSFLRRLSGWAIDNQRHVLVLNDAPGPTDRKQEAALPPSQDTTAAPASPARVLNPNDPAARAAIIRGQQIAQSCFDNNHAFPDKMNCLTRQVHQYTDNIVNGAVPNNRRFEMLGFSFYVSIQKGQFEETIRQQNYDEQFKRDFHDNVMAQADNLRTLQRLLAVSLDDLCTIIHIDCSVAKRLGYYWGAQVQ